MLYTILTIALVFDAILLIGLILLQQGKGADAGAAFGSGASGTVFGAGGSANFLSHTTGILATLFFALALTMAYVARHSTASTNSVIDSVTQPAATQPPATNTAKPAVTSVPAPAASTHH
ncbi:MAG TPA: preprotein translocase subunit SecG [Gammaproteobacteria bacterium]|jgi:preprotein translocase subunit SecG